MPTVPHIESYEAFDYEKNLNYFGTGPRCQTLAAVDGATGFNASIGALMMF